MKVKLNKDLTEKKLMAAYCKITGNLYLRPLGSQLMLQFIAEWGGLLGPMALTFKLIGW